MNESTSVKLDKIPVRGVRYVFVSETLLFMIRSHVLGSRVASYNVTFVVPKNWFQHLRRQLGLKYKTTESVHKITRYRTYPNADLVLPETPMGKPVTFEVMEPDDR